MPEMKLGFTKMFKGALTDLKEFLSTAFSTWRKGQDKNVNILKMERAFKMK